MDHPLFHGDEPCGRHQATAQKGRMLESARFYDSRQYVSDDLGIQQGALLMPMKILTGERKMRLSELVLGSYTHNFCPAE